MVLYFLILTLLYFGDLFSWYFFDFSFRLVQAGFISILTKNIPFEGLIFRDRASFGLKYRK